MQRMQWVMGWAMCALISASAAAQCTRVVFSANPDYPPYHWAEGDRIVGASVALTGRILDELGVQWEAKFVGPWPRVLKSAAGKNGAISRSFTAYDYPKDPRVVKLVFARSGDSILLPRNTYMQINSRHAADNAPPPPPDKPVVGPALVDAGRAAGRLLRAAGRRP